MSRRDDWTGLTGGGLIGLVAILLLTAMLFAALTAALVVMPGVPLWAVLVPALLALAAVCGATLAVTAWLTRHAAGALGPQLPDVPPLRHAERYAADPRDWQTLTWHVPGPDRAAGERPSPGLTWQCPVTPGKPRTVRDLRREPPRDLRTWE